MVQFISITPGSVIYRAACRITHTYIRIHTDWTEQTSIHRTLHSHSVTITEEWHHSIMGIFQRYQLSDERQREVESESQRNWVRRTWELTEGVTDALDQKRRVETCDWLQHKAPFTITLTRANSYHGYWERLQQRRNGVEPTSGKLSPLTQFHAHAVPQSFLTTHFMARGIN